MKFFLTCYLAIFVSLFFFFADDLGICRSKKSSSHILDKRMSPQTEMAVFIENKVLVAELEDIIKENSGGKLTSWEQPGNRKESRQRIAVN